MSVKAGSLIISRCPVKRNITCFHSIGDTRVGDQSPEVWCYDELPEYLLTTKEDPETPPDKSIKRVIRNAR